MPIKKSEIVKASIKIKNGTLQLEGPQEFVEKYLKPIVENCKPFSKAFPKPRPTAEEQDETKRRINSTAATFANLTIGLWAVALIGLSPSTPTSSTLLTALNSAISCASYILATLGVLSFLFTLYLANCPRNWRQKSVSEFLERNKAIKAAKDIVWLIVVAVFGVGLFQSNININGLKYIGLLIVAIVFIQYYYLYFVSEKRK
jgi:hypothetical protein